MDERAVRAAVGRIAHESHGLFVSAGRQFRLVPVSALDELVEAVNAPAPAAPAAPAATWPDHNDRPTWPDHNARPRY